MDRKLTALQIISLFQDASKLMKQVNLPSMSAYFLEHVFSCEFVFTKVKSELPQLSQEEKIKLVRAVRTVFYPLIDLGFNPVDTIVQFEKSVNPYIVDGLQFNDPKSWDFKLTLPDGTILHLHKKILSSSGYFGALLGERFREAGKNELLISDSEFEPQLFKKMIQYLYDNQLKIEDDVLAILAFAEKYSFEPILPIKARVLHWIDSIFTFDSNNFAGLFNKVPADDLGLQELNGLFEFVKTLNYKKLMQKILSYAFTSINVYLYLSYRARSPSITQEQFEARKTFLRQYGTHLRSYNVHLRGVGLNVSMNPFLCESLTGIEVLKCHFFSSDSVNSVFEKIVLDPLIGQLTALQSLRKFDFSIGFPYLKIRSLDVFETIFTFPKLEEFVLPEIEFPVGVFDLDHFKTKYPQVEVEMSAFPRELVTFRLKPFH